MVLLLRLLYVAKMTLLHQKLLQINAVTLTYEPANNHAVDMHAHPRGLAIYTLFLPCCSYLVIDMQLSSKDP